MAEKKFYVVWKGREPGIYSTWAACSAQVTGFNGAEYKAFPSRAAAEEAYQAKYSEYKGKQVIAASPERVAAVGRPIADSYCVDAACSGSPGPLEYRCVHTTTHRPLFQQGPFERGTNNIGEFLGLVHALALFKQRAMPQPIYTDSEIARTWLRAKKCKTKLVEDEVNRPLFDLIRRAEDWLANNTYTTRVIKWETDVWGEIPADYGRK